MDGAPLLPLRVGPYLLHRLRAQGALGLTGDATRNDGQWVSLRLIRKTGDVERRLEGWVRNRIDGAVEAVFAGPPESVAAMIDACRRGPPAAHVDTIDQRDGSVSDLALRRPGERFSVLPTA